MNTTPSTKVVKPGYKTTEFWVSAITSAGTFITALAGALPPEKAAVIIGAVQSFYAVSRGLAKH